MKQYNHVSVIPNNKQIPYTDTSVEEDKHFMEHNSVPSILDCLQLP